MRRPKGGSTRNMKNFLDATRENDRIRAQWAANRKCKTPECQNDGELIMGVRAALCTECIAMPKPRRNDMSCTNPSCECKPGSYANMNPPKTYADAAKELLAITPTVTSHIRFETYMLDGLEWQQKAAIKTASGKYRVEITWALDRYRVSVIRRVQEPEKLVRVHHPLYARTAVATANKLLKYYEQNGY